ncbi:unnamed protein product [Hymenolepis diminuta]|uniref:DH domain-containing protein n=1 Tax=Hymenolepis diminuta TaxID=6216 RepID=A0A158QF70_HYMDI|nr:unnamed protein product [Hymenolepis diminuta]
MFTQQLKFSEHPLDQLRPSSGRSYPCSRTPDSSKGSRVALKKVAWVIGELLDTEIAYLDSLRDIKEGYYQPLLALNKFDTSTLDTIFSNVVQIHAFHQNFSGELSLNQENLIGLANVFLDHAADFEELYVEFCTEHSLSIQTLEHESQIQSELWTSILECQSQLGHLLPLASYLLKPVQRILKYQLLFQELVKACTLAGLDQNHSIFNGDPTTTVDHLQSALQRMVQVANHINEAKRHHDLISQLRAGGLDVDQWGRLLLRDVFRLPAKKHACRLVLLFERAILLAKKFSYAGNNSTPNLTDLQSNSGEGLQSVLEIRDIISCNNLMLIECIDKDPLAFHILPFNNPNAQKTLQAVNAEVKHLWCREIKRVILENFDAAIPEKAKHLMLHMEDIYPKSKSSDVGNHALEELEEEQIPRRKGSNVLTEDFHFTSSPSGNGKSTSNGNGMNGNRLPTLASSEDCSETSSLTSSSSVISVCQLVSQIAIDLSSKAPSRKSHRPPPPKVSTTQTKLSKEINGPPPVTATVQNEATKVTSLRKHSAPPPSVKAPKLKPPRTMASTKVDVTPTLRTNNLGNGTGTKSISTAKASAPQPKPSSNSTVVSNSEATSLCQGRLRAAVANLKPPEGQITVIPKTATSANPSKPPRRSTLVFKTLESNGKPARPSQPPSVTSSTVRGHGHVKHLIDRFQSN